MNLRKKTIAAVSFSLAFGSALALAAGYGPGNPDSTVGGSTTAPPGGHMMSHDPQTIRHMQRALKNKGHNPGRVDGVMGPQTRSALQAYEQSQNITGASELDSRTLASLGVPMAVRTPSAGGDSSQPNLSGGAVPTGAAQTAATRPNPTPGGNSAEPATPGRSAPAGSINNGVARSSTPSAPYPTAGGNSPEPNKAGQTK